MSAEVLSLRALNRALLSRQLLIDRRLLPVGGGQEARAAEVLAVVEHLVGLQAQAPFPPYYGTRPGEDVPVPVRLAAEFDNLLLSHADRSRVISPGHLKRFYRINGIFPGSVLIDGFVAGMWRLARSRDDVALTIELFSPVAERDPLAEEAERMLAFCAPGLSHEIRFAPITGRHAAP